MRILFIRHADPDYVADGITDKGRIEAKLLADRIDTFGIDEVYVSPLGRARDTFSFCANKLDIKPVTLDWLEEFPARFDPEEAGEDTRMAFATELKTDEETGKYKKRIVWDMLPSYYKDHPELFDVNTWRDSDIVRSSDTIKCYDHIIRSFDDFLSDHGYKRSGSIYRVVSGSSDTVAFFCHFGVTSVMLSHLWGISPFVTLQFLAAAPTSVTEIVTEEREKGIAIFRTVRIGDITHLTMGGEKPSFAARFCERFENEDERH